jgi:D-beta-D-heptose 7-phosphate kinase/D-beta-D-heptose 1-phosphate adenosyltransferase
VTPPTAVAPLAFQRACDLVARIAGRHVLVVGDVMLDRFLVGRVSRISPEAPVPVVRFEREYARLGGAANVANNLVSLGARVSLVGVVGRDAAAEALRNLLTATGIDTHGVVEDAARPTVEKVRVVTERNQQVARIDYERDTDVTRDTENQLARAVATFGASADALLVSDYLKGAITAGVMRSLAALGGRSPLLVDPKIPHLNIYAGATVITPNHHEAEIATQRVIRSDEDARAAADEFRNRARCAAALITRGEHGMWLSSDQAAGPIAAVAREVSDVTGAGDTVIATLAAGLAAGATLAEAAQLANYAAGIVVGKFGPGTVSAEELIGACSAVSSA